jgi:hypothetical protein
MIASLVLAPAAGLSVAAITLGAGTWFGPLFGALADRLPLALALGLAASALTVVAAILASFHPFAGPARGPAPPRAQVRRCRDLVDARGSGGLARLRAAPQPR